jgi:cyanate lyase
MLNEFGSMLMKIRSENHESVGSMAEKLGVARLDLTSIEIGRAAVPEGMCEKIVEIYDLDGNTANKLKEAASSFVVDEGFGIDNAQGGFEFSQDRKITQAESNKLA